MSHSHPLQFTGGDFLAAEKNAHSMRAHFVPEFLAADYRGHFHALLNFSKPGETFAVTATVRNTSFIDELESSPSAEAGTVGVFWQEVSEDGDGNHTSVTRCRLFNVPALVNFALTQSGWLLLRMRRSDGGSFSFSDAKLGTVNLAFDWLLTSTLPAPANDCAYLVIAAVRVDSSLGAAEIIQQQCGMGAMPLPLEPAESDSSSSAGSESSSHGGDPIPGESSSSGEDPIPGESSSSGEDPIPGESSSSSSESSSSDNAEDGFYAKRTDRIRWVFSGSDGLTGDSTIYGEGILEPDGDCNWSEDDAEYSFVYRGETTVYESDTTLTFSLANNAWTFNCGFFQGHSFAGALHINNLDEQTFWLPSSTSYQGSDSNTMITIEFSRYTE